MGRVLDSLKTRLVFFAMVLVLLGLVLRMVFMTGFLREELQHIVSAQQLSLATYVASDIDAKLRNRQELVHTLADQLPRDLLHRPDAMAAWLAVRQDSHPLYSAGLMVLDPAGIVISDYPVLPGRRGTSHADRDWFLAARNSGRNAMGAPAVGSITHQPEIVMATPIKDSQGQLLGVLAGVSPLDAPGFLDLVLHARVGETGGFLLVAPRDRIFVAASDPPLTLQPLPAPGVNRLHDQAMAGYRGNGISVNEQGVEELASITSVPSANWFLVARTPTHEAFRPLNEIRGFLLRNSLLIAIIMATALILISNWLFHPLDTAAREVHAMAEGQLPLHPLPVARNDEVGELVTGFNLLLSKLREREAALAHLAHHDPLTSLPNRSALLDRLEQSIALAKRQGRRLALLFIDLDGFKPVNDAYGHDVGDQLLNIVAERLRGTVRKSDMVARFGGDEFVALLTDIADPANASAVAEKCLAALTVPVQIDGRHLQIGASIGIAFFPDHAQSTDALLAHADAAMYDAKREGRNCYRIAQPSDTH